MSAVAETPTFREKPIRAWFDHWVEYFKTERAARQWMADRLGGDPGTDDYGIQRVNEGQVTELLWPVLPDDTL